MLSVHELTAPGPQLLTKASVDGCDSEKQPHREEAGSWTTSLVESIKRKHILFREASSLCAETGLPRGVHTQTQTPGLAMKVGFWRIQAPIKSASQSESTQLNQKQQMHPIR